MRFFYTNRHEIAGFIGNVQELRYTASGDASIEISVATKTSWKTKSGEWKEQTEWHICTFFKNLAEDASKVLKKSDAIHIVGRSTSQEFETREGQKRSIKKIIVEAFHVIDRSWKRDESGTEELQIKNESAFQDESIPF
jgi:single-strand DNA-binding protein